MKNRLLLGFLLTNLIFLSAQVNAQDSDTTGSDEKFKISDYYPLHVGDFWIYSGVAGGMGETVHSISKTSITKDSVMPDGYTYYYKCGHFQHPWSYFERTDDALGAVITRYNDTTYNKEIFSSPINNIITMGSLFSSVSYTKGLGLTLYYYSHIVTSIRSLKGAYINGIVYGGTSYTQIGIEDEDVTTDYILDQNHPNPFNPTTNITFQMPKESFVSIVVYNMLGEKVETLLNEYRGIGKHTVTFNAQNLPSGIYFYTLQTNGLTETKKMLFLK